MAHITTDGHVHLTAAEFDGLVEEHGIWAEIVPGQRHKVFQWNDETDRAITGLLDPTDPHTPRELCRQCLQPRKATASDLRPHRHLAEIAEAVRGIAEGIWHNSPEERKWRKKKRKQIRKRLRGPTLDMRHNNAAAKHAARLAGDPDPGRTEIKVVPLAQLQALYGHLIEHTTTRS
jgi:hypothetical protein